MQIGRVLLILVGLVSALTAYLWVRRDGLRLIAQTTADPTALGQVGSTSMNPVKLRLETRRVSIDRITLEGLMPRSEPLPIARSISFEAPAAFISLVDLKQAPAGPGRIGFMVFSESFDPYRPTEIESSRLRLARRSWEEQDAPFARHPEDDRLAFELSNEWKPLEERQSRLVRLAAYGALGKACHEEITDDARYLKLTTPTGIAARDSCQNYGDGTNGFALLRRSMSSGYDYVVRCHGDGTAPESLKRPQNCTMLGYFEGWPLLVWVNHRRQADWDRWHSAIQRWLASHRSSSTAEQDPS